MLIAIGILLLLANLDLLSMKIGDLWPLMLLFIGYSMLASWFNDHINSGKIFSGILMILLGIFFLIMTFTNWVYMDSLWPAFILMPGLSILVKSVLAKGPDRHSSRVSAYILIGVSFVFFLLESPYEELWPLVLILIGLVILFQSKSIISDPS
jgi:predicted ferric reductase